MTIGPTFTNAAANTLTLYAERIGDRKSVV